MILLSNWNEQIYSGIVLTKPGIYIPSFPVHVVQSVLGLVDTVAAKGTRKGNIDTDIW